MIEPPNAQRAPRPALPDAAARERAISPQASVLLQAPAGSGKTTLLVQRYLALLAVVEGPEQILALTFTRRAAREMRERVGAALQAAALPACPAAMSPRTWELAVGATRRLDARGINVEQHASRLRIETIDAFNSWLAGQLPIAAGAGAGLRLAQNSRYLYEEAAERTLAYDEADAFGAALERVLALDDQRWRRLRALIADMLPARERWLPLLAGALRAAKPLSDAQLDAVRRRFDDDLSHLVSRTLVRAREAVGGERLSALSRLLAAAARRLGPDARSLAAWLDAPHPLTAEVAELPRWRGLISVVLTAGNEVRSRLTKSEGFPPQHPDILAMRDLLVELERDPAVVALLCAVRRLPDPRYHDGQWNRVRDVAQVLTLAAAQLEQVFRDHGTVDFPAVSLAALRALGSPLAPSDLSLRLDYRLRHILVDEFQDTSAGQIELLTLLTAGWQPGDGRTVFCVGDPMQSIYAFRQAEVRAFLGLAEDGVGDIRFDVQRLSTNFRSVAPIVDWINATFAALMPRMDERDRGAIAYRPSVSAAGIGPVTNAGVTLVSFGSRAAEADAVAELIEARTREYPHWRIAVLVRARAHARAIAHQLRARALDYSAVDLEPLGDRSPVRDLIMLARALVHLGDRTAWFALLRAPWTGLLLADLWLIAQAPSDVWTALNQDALMDRLSPSGRGRCLRLREAIAAAFAVRNHSPFARWLERTWIGLGGPACLQSPDDRDHARLAFARLRELDETGLPDPAEFSARFTDLLARGRASSAVEIMTIHKAKGLEFDLVIVPALDRSVPRSEERFILAHEFVRAEREGLVMAARPPAGAESDPLFQFLARQSMDAAALEAQRLLYVACTRAKSELYLSAVTGNGEPEDAEETAEAAAVSAWAPRPGSLLHVLWPGAGRQFTAGTASATTASAATPAPNVDLPRGGALQRVPDGWVPADAPEPPGTAALAMTVAAPRDLSPIFDWAGETSRQVGILVHAQLHALDVVNSDEAAVARMRSNFRHWLALRGVPADRLAAAVDRVSDALRAVHRDARARWMLKGGYREDVREYAVSGFLDGALIHAVFDRSFIDEHGIRWVIDYKTSQHAGGGQTEFLDREVERYRPQMQRYALLAQRMGPEPVRVGLYFPLMSAWREWQPSPG